MLEYQFKNLFQTLMLIKCARGRVIFASLVEDLLVERNVTVDSIV